MSKLQAPHVLLYDATCKFCQRGSKNALWIARPGSLIVKDINDQVLQTLYSITPEAANRELFMVSPEGQLSHGAWAVREIIKLSRWLWPLAYLWYIPGYSWLAQKQYLWIADHRYLFMGKAERHASENGAGCEGESCAIHLGLKLPTEPT